MAPGSRPKEYRKSANMSEISIDRHILFGDIVQIVGPEFHKLKKKGQYFLSPPKLSTNLFSE